MSKYPTNVHSEREAIPMKKIALTTLALAVSAGAALAADLPSRKAPVVPPPPPPPMWTGFYAGLNAGGLWSNNSSINNVAYGLYNYPYASDYFSSGTLAALSATGNITGSSNSGFIGGGQIGYNWQIGNVGGLGFGSGFVTGIEADIQGIAGSTGQGNFFGAALGPSYNPHAMQIREVTEGAFSPVTLARARQNLSYIGTVRGRLGFLAMPTLLVYGTGGLAYGGANLNVAYATADTSGVFGGSGASTSYANTQVGWTAGGGLEWMFLPNWSLKAEYLYYDLGSVQASTVVAAGFPQVEEPSNGYSSGTSFAYTTTASTRFNGNIVRAGVNYHFNWGAAPVVAKY
jgi:outer membrane immunogenic protein